MQYFFLKILLVVVIMFVISSARVDSISLLIQEWEREQIESDLGPNLTLFQLNFVNMRPLILTKSNFIQTQVLIINFNSRHNMNSRNLNEKDRKCQTNVKALLTIGNKREYLFLESQDKNTQNRKGRWGDGKQGERKHLLHVVIWWFRETL